MEKIITENFSNNFSKKFNDYNDVSLENKCNKTI